MIVDTHGNELELSELDFTIGRILQGTEEGVFVFTTWAELPDVDDQGNVIDHTPKPTTEERVDSVEDELTMTQIAITELYELVIPEEE